ncbi:MAG: cation diffusion facilitator family transporter [Oligoflexia bacterium]|nr:cation diffusion facilitator family transporter [Oligoflexia bacterium]
MSSDHEHQHEHSHAHDRSHAHAHGHSHSHGAGAAPGALRKAIVVTAIFMLLELFGGYIANSLALMTDGLHMGADVAAMAFSLFAIWISERPKTARMSFGYYRAEILGALASGLGIWLISGLLVYEAIVRLQNPPAVQGGILLVIATIGLAANLLSMKMLHGSSHGNMNVKAAYLHVLSDALGSLSAVVAGAVIWFTGWHMVDPIITMVAAALMLWSSWGLVREAVNVLMERTPEGIDPERVLHDLATLPGVTEVHDLHIWAVASGRLALSVHIITSQEPEQVISAANHLLEEDHGIIHTTIQVEHPERFSSERCYDCAHAH